MSARLTTRKISPALAAGCAIVFKPAEQTPLSTLRFAELFEKAGYPAGVFNLVQGVGRVTGEAMARHPDIDKVSCSVLYSALASSPLCLGMEKGRKQDVLAQNGSSKLTPDRLHRLDRHRPSYRRRCRRVQLEGRDPRARR